MKIGSAKNDTSQTSISCRHHFINSCWLAAWWSDLCPKVPHLTLHRTRSPFQSLWSLTTQQWYNCKISTSWRRLYARHIWWLLPEFILSCLSCFHLNRYCTCDWWEWPLFHGKGVLHINLLIGLILMIMMISLARALWSRSLCFVYCWHGSNRISRLIWPARQLLDTAAPQILGLII